MFFNNFTPINRHADTGVNSPSELPPADKGIKDITKIVFEKGHAHKRFEKKLWFANLFIIPLVVYPIVSLIGHAIIEAMTRKENHAYAKVANYLDEKYAIEKEKFILNHSDYNYINKIFKSYKLDFGYLPKAIERATYSNSEETFTFGYKRNQATSFFL